jgi:hypothetical protein
MKYHQSTVQAGMPMAVNSMTASLLGLVGFSLGLAKSAAQSDFSV